MPRLRMGGIAEGTLGLKWLVFPLGWCCLLLQASNAQVSVIPDDVLSSFALNRPDSSFATMLRVPVVGQLFPEAVQVRTFKRVENPWDIQLRISTTSPIEVEDVLLASFFFRRVAASGSAANTTFIFEQASTPYTKSANISFSESDGDWRLCRVAFKSVGTYAPGTAQVNFHAGFDPQAIEIGGISVVNYQKLVPFEALQATLSPGYSGRGPSAAWRGPATARIDQFRKANLTVEVRDLQGQAIPGARIEVKMTRHAFGFGSAVSAAGLLGTNANDAIYRETILRLFNKVVLENDLKWPNWETNPTRALAGVDWLRERGILVRGHNLIWPGWRNMPADVQSLTNDISALRARIDAHITDTATALRGRLVEWDVINEPYSNHDVMDWLGDAEMISWFQLAHAADPEAKLYLNDYGMLTVNSTNASHQNYNLSLLQYLLANGAPVNGLGLQSHFGSALTPPPRLMQILDRFTVLPVDLQSTEFDIDTTDEAVQGDYLRDFMTALFSHPRVVGIVMWGFWEGRDWRTNAALYRRDWSAKPNGLAWEDLVLRQWWTETSGTADNAGRFTMRGFKGDYEVRVEVGGVTNTFPATLLTSHTLTITLSNLQPSVVLTSPAHSAHLAAGAPILLRAAVVGAAESVNRVEFFDGFAGLGEDTLAPFTLSWTNAVAGSHAVWAEATLSGGITLTSLIAQVVVAPSASAIETLVAANAVWRYSDQGTRPATNWTSRLLDDSDWPSGLAQLGFGDGDESTLLARTNLTGSTNITYYFRRGFVVADPEAFTSLILRLLRDDGAVVYLNGVEIFRSNMPPDSIDENTLASSAVNGSEETNFYPTPVNRTLLTEGYNLLAVEVHQNTNTSSDVSFDLELTGLKTFLAPTIVSQPQNQSVMASRSVAFSITAGGTGPFTYQWFHNGAPLTVGAGGEVLSFANTLLADAGQYFVVVSNPAGSATSAPARLDVTADLSVPVSFISTGAVWKYLDTGANLDSIWRSLVFDDSAWPSGPAQLGYGDGDEATVLGFGSQTNNKYITTYFRRDFLVQGAGSITNLIVSLLRDDGGVVYLNEVEVFRSNLTNGPITYLTRALTAVSDLDEDAFYSTNVSPALLRDGPNVVAVEVHQSSPTSSDLSFDLQLEGIADGPPRLDAVRIDNRVTLAWPALPAGFVLEATADLFPLLNWAAVNLPPSVSNNLCRLTLDSVGDARYFRLRRR